MENDGAFAVTQAHETCTTILHHYIMLTLWKGNMILRRLIDLIKRTWQWGSISRENQLAAVSALSRTARNYMDNKAVRVILIRMHYYDMTTMNFLFYFL
jgi:hypothetical protein